MSDLLPEGRGSGLPGLATQASDAAAALGALAAPAKSAADAIDAAFAKAGASLAGSLSKAAADGKLSLGELAGAVITAADSLVSGSSGGGSLASALAQAVGGLFGGARADGGPVASGGAYLVGERGPEVFRPAAAGSVEPAGPGGGGGGVIVNVSVAGGGASALLRSEAQIASALARAVALGAALMTPFAEIVFPARLAFGSTGGVERRTEVVTLASGFERRATPWAHGRRRYLVGQGVRALADAQALVAFFEARRGRLQGFRFRDFADDSSAAPGMEPAATDQPIGVGDGTVAGFPLAKRYGEGDDAYLRPIAKPVAGTVLLAVDGTAAEATVDTVTGVVTFATPPTAGATVTAGFRFEVPVRFDADRIDLTLESFDAGRVTAVPLIEVRV